MYATRPLSTFKSSPMAAQQPPAVPEGPGSGYLLLQDEEPQSVTCCWGACKCRDHRIRQLPFPQNRILTLSYTVQRDDQTDTVTAALLFIPVPAQPLSSNRYYVIVAKGKEKGKVYACSKEEDMRTCCFYPCIKDVKPREFDHRDIYQQMEIVCHKGRFTAKPVASDGIPPAILRKEYWELYQPDRDDFALVELALGVDEPLRARLPELYPSMSKAHANNNDNSTVVVGSWYVPFIFVKEEEVGVPEQVKHCAFYEITLEQFWEEVHACENLYGKEKVAEVKAVVQGEAAAFLKNGREAKCYDTHDVDGSVWFKPVDSGGGSLSLSYPVWERMKWEQGRGGWTGDEDQTVERVEEYGGVGGWTRFGCYVLVERFAVRRMDRSLVLTVDFRHGKKVQSRWE